MKSFTLYITCNYSANDLESAMKQAEGMRNFIIDNYDLVVSEVEATAKENYNLT